MSVRSTLLAALLLGALPAAAAMQPGQKVSDIWKPAKTPPGGTAWALLESTKLIDRKDAKGTVYTKPAFPPAVAALNGKRVKVSGWMMPLENAAKQKHFVLLGYPPGCPFHFHAMPNQFVEIRTGTAVPANTTDPMTVSGTLQLTGQDERGIFYQINDAQVE